MWFNKLKYISLVLLVFFGTYTFSQNDGEMEVIKLDYPGNVNFSYGMMPNIYSFSLNYERRVFNFGKSKNSRAYIRFGTTCWIGDSPLNYIDLKVYPTLTGALGFAIGKGPLKFDLYLGGLLGPDEFFGFWLTAGGMVGIGCRYEPKEKRIFFRGGASSSELFYCGAGLRI